MWDRIGLYGGGLAAAGLLGYFGFFWTPAPGFDVRMSDVLELSRAGKLEEAHEETGKLQKEFPGDPRGHLLEGFLAEKNDELETAREAYEKASSLSKSDNQRRDILLSIADISRRLGNPQRAHEGLVDIVAQYGENCRTRHLRIILAIDEKNYVAASSELEILAEENPGNPVVPRLRHYLGTLTKDNAAVSDKPAGDQSDTGR